MNRSVAFIVSGICAAPLLALAGMMLTHAVTRSGGGGSDQSIAQGYASILGGGVLAVLGGIVIWYVTRRVVPDSRIGYLLAADLILLAVGLVAWRRTFAETPRLEYAEATALLQVEVRVPQELLAGDRVDAVVGIDFAGGDDASVPHPELARVDGDATILPWETTPIRVERWAVRVIVRDTELMFDLPLARVPEGSLDWSAWMEPAESLVTSGVNGVTLRYRFLVHGRGS